MADRLARWAPLLLRGIVGFELSIEKLEGKYKLSQNREPADHAGAREGLMREGRTDVARLMTRPEPKPETKQD